MKAVPEPLLPGVLDSVMSLVSRSSYQNTTAFNLPSLQAMYRQLLTSCDCGALAQSNCLLVRDTLPVVAKWDAPALTQLPTLT